MHIQNLRHLGHLDIPGGGQVYVKDRVAFIGHLAPPLGTSVVDVSSPGSPRILAQLTVPPTTHCHKTNPIPIATFIVPASAVENRAGSFGCHQPQEQVYDTILGVTWFSGGLRLVDIKDPFHPTEVGHFVPDPVGNNRSAQSNDVLYDGNGLLYVIDRFNGLDILERRR